MEASNRDTLKSQAKLIEMDRVILWRRKSVQWMKDCVLAFVQDMLLQGEEKGWRLPRFSIYFPLHVCCEKLKKIERHFGNQRRCESILNFWRSYFQWTNVWACFGITSECLLQHILHQQNSSTFSSCSSSFIKNLHYSLRWPLILHGSAFYIYISLNKTYTVLLV